MPVRGYAQVAAEIREEIRSGQLPPGVALGSEARLAAQRGVSRGIIKAALALLRSEGLVTTIKGGSTYIRDRRTVHLPVSRYSATFNPGLPAPWQAAAQAAGLHGSVRVVAVDLRSADATTADQLAIAEGDQLIVRVRHNMLGEHDPEIVQISTSTIPYELVRDTPLAGDQRIPSGVYAAFAAIGHTPTEMTETVRARMPTPDEAGMLGLAPGMPVLEIDRITWDQDGRPIELVHVVSIADRTALVYDRLPISRAVDG